jgi:hypothetical protein
MYSSTDAYFAIRVPCSPLASDSREAPATAKGEPPLFRRTFPARRLNVLCLSLRIPACWGR